MSRCATAPIDRCNWRRRLRLLIEVLIPWGRLTEVFYALVSSDLLACGGCRNRVLARQKSPSLRRLQGPTSWCVP